MKVSKLYHFLFSAMLVVTIVGCGKKTSEESIASAKTFIQSGELDAAIVELKNAVQADPEVPATRLMLGKLSFETGRLNAAEKELRKAQDLGSQANDVLPLLSQTYYYSEQFDLASRLSVGNITDSEALSTVNLMRYLASLRNDEVENPLALEDVSDDLSELDNQLAQSYRAFNDTDFKLSAELLESLKQENYRPLDTEYLQAMLNVQQADFAAAAQNFAKVNQLMPFSNSVNFQEIEALIKAKLYQDAEQKTDALLSINQEHPLLNLYKANIAYDAEKYESALFFAEKAIQNGVDNSIARVIAGVSAYKIGTLEKAYENLNNLINLKGLTNTDVLRLFAHVQLSLGYNDDAVNSLRNMTDLQIEDLDLISQAGMKLASKGDLAGAKEMLAKAKKLDDGNVSTIYREVMVNIGTDDDAVIDGLNALLAQDPAVSQGWMHLAMAHVRNGDQKGALEVANKWEQIDPVNGLTLKGVVYFKSNNMEKAISALKSALEMNPNQMGAHQYLLMVYEKSQQYDALYSHAERVLTLAPDNMSAMISIAKAGQILDKSNEADVLLTQMTQQDKVNVSAYVALAVSARLQGELQRVIDILAPHHAMLPNVGLMLLGDTYLLLGQTDLALTTYQEWKMKSPTNLMPALRVIGLSERKGNDYEALTLTEDALKQFPNQPALLMLKVNFLTKLKRFSEAKKLVVLIKSQDTSHSFALLDFYEGQLALGEKNYPLAEELLASYYKTSPNLTTVLLLAKAMQGNGNIAAAKTLLEEAVLLKQVEPSSRLRHTVAEFYLQNGFFEEAIAQYEILIEMEGEMPASLNNLAYALQQDKQLEKALKVVQKAVQLAPNSAEIVDTLGWIQFELGNEAEAYKHLNEALRLAPKSNSIMLHLAQVQIALGQHEQARQLLKKLYKPSKYHINQRRDLLSKI